MRGSASVRFISLIIGTFALSSSALAAPDAGPSPSAGDESAASGSLIVRLHYDRQAAQPLTLLEYEKSPLPLPTQRDPSLKAHEWLLEGEDAGGVPLWTRRIHNPILVFFDELDPAAPPDSGRLRRGRRWTRRMLDPAVPPGSGRLRGGPRWSDKAVNFTVEAPPTPGLARINAYAPHVAPGGDEEAPEKQWLGSCAVDPLPSPSPSSFP